MSIYEYHLKQLREKLAKARTREDHTKIKEELLITMYKIINTKKEAIIQRAREYLEYLQQIYREELKLEIYEVVATLKTNLIVNINDPFLWTINEIGLAWDKTLDTPYIPSSTIKGAISTAIQCLVASNMLNKSKNIKANDIKNAMQRTRDTILGNQENIALIEMTDAYPIEVHGEELAKIEVMTPIYKDNIEEHLVNPVPIKYLVVAPNVVFKFLIAITSRNKKQKEQLIEALKKTTGWQTNDIKQHLEKIVREALETIGIGAKTSSGYGIFTNIKVEKVE